MAIDNRKTITIGRWAVSAQAFLDQFIVWAEELPDGTKMTGGAKDALDRMLAQAKDLQAQETV